METSHQALIDQLPTYSAQMAQQRCPLCDAMQWDDGVLVLTPIANATPFDTDEPYKANALLASAVFTCQDCRAAQWLTLGRMGA